MANEIKSIREALRGHFDSETLGDYGKEALKGAGFGAAAGLAAAPFTAGWSAAALPAEAGMGALGWMGLRGIDDIAYGLFSKEKKIAWLAGDLQDIIQKELAPAIKNTNPQAAEAISLYAEHYKNYIDYYIRDHKKGLMEDNAIVQTIDANGPSQQQQMPVSPEQPQTQPDVGRVLQEFMLNGQGATRGGSSESTKFIKVATMPGVNPSLLLKGAKGVTGLGVGMLADWGVGKGYDYGAKLFRGTRQISSAIMRSKKILTEIDKISAGLSNDLLTYIRAGSSIIYNQIGALEKQYPL
jgi:hypothetical protein